jgi:hypothetical protein
MKVMGTQLVHCPHWHLVSCFDTFSYLEVLNISQYTEYMDSSLKFCHIEVFTLCFFFLPIDGFILALQCFVG